MKLVSVTISVQMYSFIEFGLNKRTILLQNHLIVQHPYISVLQTTKQLTEIVNAVFIRIFKLELFRWSVLILLMFDRVIRYADVTGKWEVSPTLHAIVAFTLTAAMMFGSKKQFWVFTDDTRRPRSSKQTETSAPCDSLAKTVQGRQVWLQKHNYCLFS